MSTVRRDRTETLVDIIALALARGCPEAAEAELRKRRVVSLDAVRHLSPEPGETAALLGIAMVMILRASGGDTDEQILSFVEAMLSTGNLTERVACAMTACAAERAQDLIAKVAAGEKG